MTTFEERLAEVYGKDVGGIISDLYREREHLHRQVAELQASNSRLVQERRTHLRSQVQAFFAMAEQAQPETPCVPDEKTVRLRLLLVAEEFFELLNATLGKPPVRDIEAWKGWNEAHSNVSEWMDKAALYINLVETADALADILFTTEGMLISLGIDSGPLMAEIARSNATKSGAPIVAGKLQKGSKYEAPRVAEVLRAQGARL